MKAITALFRPLNYLIYFVYFSYYSHQSLSRQLAIETFKAIVAITAILALWEISLTFFLKPPLSLFLVKSHQAQL